jgi:hypothetical protein
VNFQQPASDAIVMKLVLEVPEKFIMEVGKGVRNPFLRLDESQGLECSYRGHWNLAPANPPKSEN